MKFRVISIGYGRHLFQADNNERLRQENCAKETAGLDLIIFSHQSHQLKSQTGQYGLCLHPTNSASKIRMIFDAYQIAKKIILANNKEELIVTTQDPFEAGLIGYLLKLRFGIKLNVQEHGDVFSTKHWQQESILNRLRFFLGKFIIKRADSVRVVSKRIISTVQKLGVDERKINLLPVAIDLNGFTNPQPADLTDYFSADDFVFLSVARFVPQKNLLMMVQAFLSVANENRQIKLLLVGDGPVKKDVEALLTENPSNSDCIKIISWSNDVPGLMASADAYVLSSNYEGWGRVLIEALASDLPIITTDVGCAGEVVLNNIHGLVTPVDDQVAFKKAILKISQDQDFYLQCLNNIKTLDKGNIPGVNIDNYGQAWAKALLS